MSDRPCECDAPGDCPRFGKRMVGRLFEICQGKAITPEICAEYRAEWDREAGRDVPRIDPTYPCEYRGEFLEAVECKTCQGLVKIKTFVCNSFKVSCELGNSLEGVRSCKLCEARHEPAKET